MCPKDRQNILELEAVEINEQGGEFDQKNTLKANFGQLVDQDILNEYFHTRIGLAVVPEVFNDEEKNDQWLQDSIRLKQSR